MNGKNASPLVYDPWRQREHLGFLKAFGLTVQQIVTSPVNFFQGIDIRQSCQDPFLFYFIVSIVAGLPTLFLIPSLPLSVAFLRLLLATILGIAVNTGFMHLFVWFFKGQGSLRGTFHILAYASVVSFLSWVPFAGQWLALICYIILAVIGYKVIHGFETGKAILIYILPFVALFTVTAVLFPLFYSYQIRSRITKNEATAAAVLSDIRSAIAAYAGDHDGEYPKDESQLLEANPPYLPPGYRQKIGAGYRLNIELNPNSYKLTAQPEICNKTGRNIFILEPGQDMITQACQARMATSGRKPRPGN